MNDRETFLLKALVALVKKHNGELRVGIEEVENTTRGVKLFVDRDAITSEIVLRCGSKSADMLSVEEPEQKSLWTETAKQPATEQPNPAPKSSIILNDETIARIENRLVSRARQRKQEKEQQEAMRVTREMFSGESRSRS